MGWGGVYKVRDKYKELSCISQSHHRPAYLQATPKHVEEASQDQKSCLFNLQLTTDSWMSPDKTRRTPPATHKLMVHNIDQLLFWTKFCIIGNWYNSPIYLEARKTTKITTNNKSWQDTQLIEVNGFHIDT